MNILVAFHHDAHASPLIIFIRIFTVLRSLPMKLSVKGRLGLSTSSYFQVGPVREMVKIVLERMESLIPREDLAWKGSIHLFLGDGRIRRICSRGYNDSDHRQRGAQIDWALVHVFEFAR